MGRKLSSVVLALSRKRLVQPYWCKWLSALARRALNRSRLRRNFSQRPQTAPRRVRATTPRMRMNVGCFRRSSPIFPYQLMAGSIGGLDQRLSLPEESLLGFTRVMKGIVWLIAALRTKDQDSQIRRIGACGRLACCTTERRNASSRSSYCAMHKNISSAQRYQSHWPGDPECP